LLILVYGVATDICVAQAARAVLNRGHRVQLATDAIAAINEKKAAVFLESFHDRGGTLVDTRDIVRWRLAA
jgi:nicotinamidase-related amidase